MEKQKEIIMVYGRFQDTGRIYRYYTKNRNNHCSAREKAFKLQRKLLLSGIETHITREFVDNPNVPWYFVKGVKE